MIKLLPQLANQTHYSSVSLSCLGSLIYLMVSKCVCVFQTNKSDHEGPQCVSPNPCESEDKCPLSSGSDVPSSGDSDNKVRILPHHYV